MKTYLIAYATHVLATSSALVSAVAISAVAVSPSFQVSLGGAQKWNTIDYIPTQLIAHRGERAFSLPEHTLPAYHLAIWEHADYVEPDLVLTKDGELVIYHDLSIKSSSNVADHPEFAHLMRNVTISDPDGSGGNVTLTNDWLIHDFTLAELKTLKLKVVGGGPENKNMRLPAFFDGMFTIPTFQEYLDLVHTDAAKLGRRIGVIPEMKHPAWHNSHYDQPHFMEDKVLSVLETNGYPLRGKNPERGPLVIQSFEADAAKYVRSKSDVDVVQLIYGNVDILTPKGLDEVAKYATILGPWKELYTVGAENVFKYEIKADIPPDVQKRLDVNGGVKALIPPQELSKEIKKRGLKQTPYTFYSSYEQSSLYCARDEGCPATQDRKTELFYFMGLGMDGLFVENVAEAVAIRQQFADTLSVAKGPAIVNYTRGKFEKREPMEMTVELEALREELLRTYPARAALGRH